jgi:FkbM family methyltransferase
MSTRLRYLYRAYRYRFRVDPAEIRFVRQSLRPGQVAVDIGCHKGAYTYWMRRRVGPSGVVYAFEPQPRQVAYLRDVFSAMHYDNVVLVPMAVSNKCGQMSLYMPAESTHIASLEPRNEERGARNGKSFGRSPDRDAPVTASLAASAPGRPSVGECAESGEQRTTLVNVTTIDQFFGRVSRKTGANSTECGVPNFVKIDVEGHELAVLEGARRTLETHRPTLLIECEARHRPDGDVRSVFDFLKSVGYTGSFFCYGSRRPLIEFDVAVHQHVDRTRGRVPGGYANNFAFNFES